MHLQQRQCAFIPQCWGNRNVNGFALISELCTGGSVALTRSVGLEERDVGLCWWLHLPRLRIMEEVDVGYWRRLRWKQTCRRAVLTIFKVIEEADIGQHQQLRWHRLRWWCVPAVSWVVACEVVGRGRENEDVWAMRTSMLGLQHDHMISEFQRTYNKSPTVISVLSMPQESTFHCAPLLYLADLGVFTEISRHERIQTASRHVPPSNLKVVGQCLDSQMICR